MTGRRAIIESVPPRRRHPGITVRHRADCPARADHAARCRCRPAFRASVWIADPRQPGAGQRLWRTFDSLDEALLWRGQAPAQARRDAGATLRSGGRVPTVQEAGDALLGGMESGAIRKRGGGEYRPGVIRAYRRSLKLYVYPLLGGVRLDEVRQPDLLDLAERLQAAGRSPSTIRNALDPLRVVYRRAVARGVVAANPTTSVELPAGEKRRDRVADPVEAARLVAAHRRLDDRALWAVALYAGLRAGELRALVWGDVDLARADVAVRASLSVDAPTEDEETDPKTRAGLRTVPLAPPAIDALTALKADRAPGPDDRVFPGQHGGPFARTSVMRRARAAWTAAGVDEIGLHEARHSAASMWIASGLSIKLVSEFIGHASVAITLDRYGHVFRSDVGHAAATFAAYLERADTDARLRQLDDGMAQ
jgi:integrase